jgi:hypothetical protein
VVTIKSHCTLFVIGQGRDYILKSLISELTRPLIVATLLNLI